MGRKYRYSFILIVVLCFFFSACNRVELYQNLGEEDANQMLVLLSGNNIKAYKKKDVQQNEVFWSIAVNQTDIIRARELLVSHHLPKRRQLGLTGVYKEKGLIPTPDEQKARFLLALKGEIINSLESVPEVVDADVVLNVPTVDEFADEETKKRLKPTASAVVRSKPSPSSNLSEAKIQLFVANAVEGLNPRDVAVIISYIDAPFNQLKSRDMLSSSSVTNIGPDMAMLPNTTTEEVIGLKMDVESKKKLKIYVLIFLRVSFLSS